MLKLTIYYAGYMLIALSMLHVLMFVEKLALVDLLVYRQKQRMQYS